MKLTSILLFFSFVSILHCQAQKRLIRAAANYEAQGLYVLAAEKYMEVLHNNATRTEYLASLQRTAQRALDEKLNRFFVESGSDEYEKALSTYEDAEHFAKKLMYFKITLKFPEHYKRDYRERREAFIDALYNEGVSLLKEDKFQPAADKFAKINNLDPDYRDVKELLMTATVEPLYRQAVEAFNRKDYPASWSIFERVASYNENYKQTLNYKQRIIDGNAFTVSVLPVQNSDDRLKDQLRSNILASLMQLENPMLRIVDRENISQIIGEQKLGLSGMIDESSAAQVGKILGAKYVLVSSLVRCDFAEGPLVRREQIAYEGIQIRVKDPVTGAVNYPVQYKPVRYFEYQQRNALKYSFHYQLISSETALVVASDIINDEIEDILVYAEYPGNYLSLYPAAGDKIYKSGVERDQFLARFSSTKNVSGRSDLEFRCQSVVAGKVATSLDAYWKMFNR